MLAEELRGKRRFWAALAALLAVAAALRFVDLGADPSPFKRSGDLVDEGYWAHGARLAALGVPLSDDLVQADASAPLASVVLRGAFELFGVSYASARIPSAAAGVLLVCAVAWFAATAWGRSHALVAAFLVAFADVAVIYSRLGLPEMLQTLFLAGALILLVHPARRRPLLAGVLASLGVLAKVTTVYYAPALLGAVWCMDDGGRARLRTLARFAAGCAPLPLAWLAFVWLPHAEAYAGMARMVARYNGGGRLFAFDVHRVPLNYFFGMPSIALLCAASLVTASDRAALRADRTRRALLACASGFLLVFAFAADRSDRRCVPLVVPLVLVAAHAIVAAPAPAPAPAPAMRASWCPPIAAGAAAVALAAAAGFRGSLGEALGAGAGRTVACIALAGAVGAAVAALRAPLARAARVAAWALSGAVFVAPALVGAASATHTMRDAARDFGSHAGPGTEVAGPFASSFSLEGGFYPVFAVPGAKELAALNARFDRTRFDYQLVAPRAVSAWGPPGLGLDAAPERIAVYALAPDLTGRPRWVLEAYRLQPGRAADALRPAAQGGPARE